MIPGVRLRKVFPWSSERQCISLAVGPQLTADVEVREAPVGQQTSGSLTCLLGPARGNEGSSRLFVYDLRWMRPSNEVLHC